MDDLLAEKLFRSYRMGLLLPPPSRDYRKPSFDFLFKQVFSLKVPVKERVAICKIWSLSSSGLRLTREGRLDEAFENFCHCWADLSQFESARNNMLLAMSPLEAAHAYFEYRRGDYDSARTKILKAMETDLELESDVDFMLLEMHRLQSAQNLMRIDLRSGEPKRALALAGQILAYAEGFIESLPVHHSWQGRRFVANTPPSVRRIIIPQVALDVAIAFSRFSLPSLESEFLEHAHMEEYLSRPRTLHHRFRLWLLTKHAFHHSDWDRYMPHLIEFLPTGRAGFQIPWYSALLDLLELCRRLNSRASARLRERILRDAKKWPGIPIPFRHLLGLTTNEETPSRLLPEVPEATLSVGISNIKLQTQEGVCQA